MTTESDTNTSKKIIICSFNECNRKLKLSDYSCKCELIFCRFHRSPESHNCTYDFKENHQKKEKIENMKCIKKKVISI
jgi:hypothetical protein